MKTRIVQVTVPTLLAALALFGCAEKTAKKMPPPISGKITTFAEVAAFTPIPVQGYGLVAGLAGTGSAQCPPQVRNYLRQYIMAQLPANSPVTADQLIDSPDTAVVRIGGVLPAAAAKGERFDLQITPVPGTKTTSFAGGTLYTANLMFTAGTRIIASAQGPVFIDTLGEPPPTKGYVLGGGSADDAYDLALALYLSDFRTANVIRNRISEQFGESTVAAASAGIIQIKIPPRYARQKARFVALLKELYINENPQQEAARAERLTKELGHDPNGFLAEISLEAIGRTQETKIVAALASPDPQTRFRAARCLLFLANDQGLNELRKAAIDLASPYRLDAIEAIAVGAKRSNALGILKQFLTDSDIKIRLAAYEQLRTLDDPAITTVRVANDFEIDQVFCTGPKMIYVYRSGSPRIVLFGAPLIAKPNIFIESADGTVFVNSPAENKYVNVVRRYPEHNIVHGPLKSSFDLVDIIRTLSERSTNESKKRVHIGLELPYADTIAILRTMCDKGSVDAEFVAGPLPKFKAETPPAPPTNAPANVMESSPKGR